MDCAPLNLAHFHERRAEKLLKRQLYADAYEAIEMSLQHLQRIYDRVNIPKSKEVLRTQQWDFERKLKQIMHKKRSCHKQIEQLQQTFCQCIDKDNSVISVTATASSIGSNISITQINDSVGTTHRLSSEYASLNTGKFKFELKSTYNDKADDKVPLATVNCNILTITRPTPSTLTSVLHSKSQAFSNQVSCEKVYSNDCHNRNASALYNAVAAATTNYKDDDFPLLAPLDLPTFDYNVLLTAKLMGNIQKT